MELSNSEKTRFCERYVVCDSCGHLFATLVPESIIAKLKTGDNFIVKCRGCGEKLDNIIFSI